MTTHLTLLRFAVLMSNLAAKANRWANDTLIMVEVDNGPPQRRTIERFCAEMREHIAYIEEWGKAATAAGRDPEKLLLHAICEQYEADFADPGRAMDAVRDALGRRGAAAEMETVRE